MILVKLVLPALIEADHLAAQRLVIATDRLFQFGTLGAERLDERLAGETLGDRIDRRRLVDNIGQDFRIETGAGFFVVLAVDAEAVRDVVLARRRQILGALQYTVMIGQNQAIGRYDGSRASNA